MDSVSEIEKNAYENNNEADLSVKCYTIGIKHKWSPFCRKHQCYRHEVTDTGHLVLYRIDKTQIAIPIANRAWIVYSNYWDFMNQFKKK
jgi:hypothetical protein